MAKEFAKGFYKSKNWQRCREGFAKSKSYLCERCLSKGIYKPGEIVHHKIELNADNINDPAISLDWSNLELLCRDCHGEAHRKRKRYKVDDIGRLVL